jgi:uncharacterized protein YjbI with pentapeptide repeats
MKTRFPYKQTVGFFRERAIETSLVGQVKINILGIDMALIKAISLIFLAAYLANYNIAYSWSKEDVHKLRITGQCRSCDLSGFVFPDGSILVNADLRGANLRGADLRGAVLTGANFIGANLSSAEIYQGSFLSWDEKAQKQFKGVDFSKADLSGAKLSCAYLDDVNFSGATLVETDLTCSRLRGANLSGAKLSLARLRTIDFRNANLVNADFSKTEIWACDFDGANLSGANFKDADLSAVSLRNTDLRRVKNFPPLDRIRWAPTRSNPLEGTILPDGIKHQSIPRF